MSDLCDTPNCGHTAEQHPYTMCSVENCTCTQFTNAQERKETREQLYSMGFKNPARPERPPRTDHTTLRTCYACDRPMHTYLQCAYFLVAKPIPPPTS